ncbi:MAG: TonB-dependent receptor [Bacteroidetes bacterium]|nr:MAG: TonB-dependent receptor [Bacteroidota bacterium]
MHKIATILSLVLFTANLWGQGNWGAPPPAIKGKISGTVTDSLTGQPVEFATIVVLDPKTGKEINGDVTDEKGHFKMFVNIGTYRIHISFLGYQPKIVEGKTMTKKDPDLDLGTVFLVPESLNLDEITVTTDAATIENKIDRIVYNAEKDATNLNGDAADVLRKAPLLAVDFDGNVSLRGSSNVRILINGKPSGMFSSNVGDALKSIPAEQIKSVEVITNPSAKYDGEGSAGIVNIITKKKTIEGFTGSVNASAGTRNNSLVLNLSGAKGRFGINGNASAYYYTPNDGTLDFDRFDTLSTGQINHLMQDGTSQVSRLGFNASVGAFYDFNAYSSINTSFRINGFKMNNDGNTHVEDFNALTDTRQIFDRKSQNDRTMYGFDWNTDFTKKFDDSKRELVLAVQLSGNVDNRIGDNFQSGNFDFLTVNDKANNDGTNLETTLQADYTHPFSDQITLEIGGKTVLRDLQSDYRFDTLDLASNFFVQDFSRSDLFDYNQNVYAGYASFNIQLRENLGLIIGGRYERTEIEGKFASDQQTPFTNQYDNFLPSITLSRSFKNYSSVKLSYSKRIQRPSLFYINPYTDQIDRTTRTQGNPLLAPEISRQVELNYNAFVKGVVLNASLYYKRTDDIIEAFNLGVIQEGNERYTKTTNLNIGYNNAVGMNFFTSATIKKIWTIRGNINVSTYATRSDSTNLKNDGIVYNAFVNSNLKLKHGIQVDFFALLNSPRRTIQGTNPSFSMYVFGVKKELFDKRGSIGISMVEPFNKYKSFDSKTEGNGFKTTSNYSIPFRSFGLSFSYRFGKLNFKAKQRQSKIKNDDLKGGDNGNGQAPVN